MFFKSIETGIYIFDDAESFEELDFDSIDGRCYYEYPQLIENYPEYANYSQQQLEVLHENNEISGLDIRYIKSFDVTVFHVCGDRHYYTLSGEFGE